jgi:hypothetical protein
MNSAGCMPKGKHEIPLTYFLMALTYVSLPTLFERRKSACDRFHCASAVFRQKRLVPTYLY